MTYMTPKTSASEKIQVMIVDDSAAVRRGLSDIIRGEPDLELMAVARDPYIAAEKMRAGIPDVIFLDIEMPRMDGLTFLRRIMAQRPIPVVICSSLTEQGSASFLEALEAGAVDVISKPRLTTPEELAEARMHICDVARAAAHSRIGARRRVFAPIKVEKKLSADAILPPFPHRRIGCMSTDQIVVIGVSTGGTEALCKVLPQLPTDCLGIVIVQHMPQGFTAAFAKRLDGMCAISVHEATHAERVLPGQALIAPGNRHTLIERAGQHYRVVIRDGPHVSRHRPSADVLFRSAAQAAGPDALGVIMTGMGDDGAQGLLEMQTAGAQTIAQDEESCIVFGMPKEAIARGGVSRVLSLDAIPDAIINSRRGRRKVSVS